MKLALTLLVLSQFKAQPFTSSSVTPSSTPNIVQATTAALSLFVDPTGNDANACTGTGTAACLTIQAALNKAPKLIRHGVTVSVAAGTYAGFIISGFTSDVGEQQTTGGLMIDGALANSTLATGSATGTAAGAGQTAGSGSTFGTLCDSGATWTVNDLRGRLVTTALPTNTALVVSSNTATCLTVVGTWTLPVAAQTTYAIQDPSVIINTAVSLPANPIAAATANNAAILVAGNQVAYRLDTIVVRKMRLSNASGNGIRVEDGSSYLFNQMQVRPSGAAIQGVIAGAASFGASTAQVTLRNIDVSLSSAGRVVDVNGGMVRSFNSLYRNAGSAIDGWGIGSSNSTMGQFVFSASELQGLGQTAGAALAVWGGFVQGSSSIAASRISCFSTTSFGIFLGPSTDATTTIGAAASLSSITTVNISGCGTALNVTGPTSADVTSMTGSATTTGFNVTLGGFVAFAKAGVTLTAGTNEINLDATTATSTFAGITAGQCLSTSQGSRACAR